MNRNSTGQSTTACLMLATFLFGANIANAQRIGINPTRPPVAGDGEFDVLPPNTVIPQEFYIERPTLENAGFEWYVSGDDNHNATVTVRFREVGTSAWREGLPLLRIQREKIWGHEQRDVYETPNMFAGSIFGLEPGTTYECEFTMADPDGLIGVATTTEIVTTRSIPKPYEHGRVFHVYPMGYEGERENPSFTGLNEAYYGYNGAGDWWLYSEPRVRAGDTIKVHAGTYSGERYIYAQANGLDFHGHYVLTQKGTADRPISIIAAGDGEVIFDGKGSDGSNYNLFNVMAAEHHYFEGLTIKNTDIGFLAGWKNVGGSSGLSVVNCKTEAVGNVVLTHWAGSNDFYIADNTMIGTHSRTEVRGWSRVDPPAPIDTYNAVKVYGQGHVVCHNYIAYYHDGICIDTHGRPQGHPGEYCASIDFYNNDIFVVADNFIETDGGAHNLRVYNNRGINVWHSALSSQPVFGGPAYFIRNVVHAAGDSLKFSARPAGMVVYNNTFCSETRVSSYSNGQFRNNLFLGNDPESPALSSMSYTSYTSFDYNGYRKKPNANPLFQFVQPADLLRDYTLTTRGRSNTPGTPMSGFKSLEAFSAATGQEKNGVMLDYDVLEGVEPPDPNDKARVYQLEEFDFRLRAGSAAVDAGTELPSLTDGFIGDGPDLGAYERGKPTPVYGPRFSNLFDGKTLNGWTNAGNANWRVEDGAITVDEGEAGLLVHEDTYQNYELKLEFKAAKGCNSGIFLNTDKNPGDVGKNCYELNIADPANPFPTGSLVKRVKYDDAGETDTWRKFEIRVVDNHVTVKLDGKQIVDYVSDTPTTGKLLGLQKNSGRVAFRNIELRKLK